MPKVIKKAWSIVTGIAIGIVILLTVLLVGVRIFGIQPYTVISGSMEPTYPVGCMIYVKPVEADTLEVGDPVTFYLNGSVVATHRIIEVLPDPQNPEARYFRTQGDANTADDGEPFHSSKVIGKPIFHVPGLGYLSNFIQNQPGRGIALGTVMVLLVAVMIPTFFSLKDTKESEEKSDPAEQSGESDSQS